MSEHFPLTRNQDLFSASARQITSKVFWQPGISQREIVDQTQIAQQSASRIIKELAEQGVLNTQERAPTGGRGKPGIDLFINPDFAYGLGFSITPEFLSMTLIDLEGKTRHSYTVRPSYLDVDTVMDTFKVFYAQMEQETDLDLSKILGCGVGIAGYFVNDETQMNYPYFIESWMNVDILALFEDTFKVPVWVENDATAAAGGEGVAGAGRQYTDFAYVYIATLFGGGIVANREVLRGANGNAGELAELLPPGIYPHPNLNLLKTILDRNNQPYESVIEMLDKLDLDQPGVDEWVHYCKNSLTLVMSSCAALLDTQAIIIGGRITEELTNKLLEVSHIYAQNRRKSPRPLPVMISAKAEGDPVAIGAAAIPFRHFIT